MGQGPFDINRPFTAGDSGWFGAPRPLVGAANAISAIVTTQSAAQVAIANSTPERVQNLRDQINDVNKAIDNKEAKLEMFEEVGEFTIMRDEGISMRAAERRRNNLIDELEMLRDEKARLVNKYNSLLKDTREGDLLPREIEDGIEEPVENAVKQVGISKGPFIDVNGGQTMIVFSKVNIREEDLAQTEENLDEVGFQVSSVRGEEIQV